MRWKPIEQPKDAFSIIIACNAALAPMLAGNIEMIRRQKDVTFFGKHMNLRDLSAVHVEKMTRELLTLETAVAGTTRPVVKRYLDSIGGFARKNPPTGVGGL